MWFCGIDWAERHLDFCLEKESGDVVKRHRVDNNEDGFSSLMKTFSQHAIKTNEIAVAIESPHEPVVDFLLARSIGVYPVNPTAIDQYRKSQKVSGSKSDAADAQFPQAIEIFDDLTCPTALDFLSQFPNELALATQTQADWIRFLDEHRVFNPKARQRFLSAIKHPPITIDSVVVQAKSWLTEALVAQLKPLIAALNGYRKRIEELPEKFKAGTRFKSLPGVDVILAAKLLVTIGTDRARFESANEMQCFFGTAPYTKASGKYKSVHFRKACHKGTRAALQQMALASLTNFQY